MYMVRSFHPGQMPYRDLQLAVTRHFFEHHSARPEPGPEEFWCLTDRDGRAPGYACIGLSWGDGGKLFSEHYLNVTLDELYAVTRPQIVEIGQFSSFGARGAGRFLMASALRSLAARQNKRAVLTATEQVRTLIADLGASFDDLGPATLERVRDKHVDWGSYYTRRPRVIAVDLCKGLNCLRQPSWKPLPAKAEPRYLLCNHPAHANCGRISAIVKSVPEL